MMRGQYNSSITRVRPVFQQLIHKADCSWIGNLLQLFQNDLAQTLSQKTGSITTRSLICRKYCDKILKQYGIESIPLEYCFEYSLAPTETFLEWLIQNPAQLSWPANGIYSKPTEIKRRALLRGDKTIQQEALEQLKICGVKNSAKKWWAFEGFTEVDCLIETDAFILAIEGKRTEEGPSSSVSWYLNRNQIIRNLEVVQQFAQGKPFVVVLIDEKGDFAPTRDCVDFGLPHFKPEQRKDLLCHFLGAITWEEICSVTGVDYNSLPATSEKVAARLKE